MVGRGKLAVFEGSNISETEEDTPNMKRSDGEINCFNKIMRNSYKHV